MTRIDYDGTLGYISSEYTTIQASEIAALQPQACVDNGEITTSPSWKYAEFSKIHSGAAALHHSEVASPKGTTVCANVEYGIKGGASVKTQHHPDGTPKVIGGATMAVVVSGGTTFADGTPENKVTPSMARILKDKLLAAGYDV